MITWLPLLRSVRRTAIVTQLFLRRSSYGVGPWNLPLPVLLICWLPPTGWWQQEAGRMGWALQDRQGREAPQGGGLQLCRRQGEAWTVMSVTLGGACFPFSFWVSLSKGFNVPCILVTWLVNYCILDLEVLCFLHTILGIDASVSCTVTKKFMWSWESSACERSSYRAELTWVFSISPPPFLGLRQGVPSQGCHWGIFQG